MSEVFANEHGRIIVKAVIEAIKENRAFLSEIDGTIGDGDHGINMAKGATLAEQRIPPEANLTEALKILGHTMITEIGGAMGPLYGQFFQSMSKATEGKEYIDAQVFGHMLEAAYAAISRLGEAKVGDKTLVDTLDPAVRIYQSSTASGEDFRIALQKMRQAAEKGKDSTKDLVAKVGRSSRLGERSRGVLDAGATSCWLILTAIAVSAEKLIVSANKASASDKESNP